MSTTQACSSNCSSRAAAEGAQTARRRVCGGPARGTETRGLAGEHGEVTAYATPRRLAAHVSAVHAVAADQEVTRKVMPVSVALDASGQPTAALRKALAKLGREALADRWPDAKDGPDRLYEDADGKARALFLRSMAKGVTLAVGLQAALDDTIAQLPIPKVMSYQLADGWTNVQFVRPVHGLVALHGADVVPVHALGLEAGRDTLGHRFEASRRADPCAACRSLRSATGSAGCGDRGFRAPARRDRAPVAARGQPARAQGDRRRRAAR